MKSESKDIDESEQKGSKRISFDDRVEEPVMATVSPKVNERKISSLALRV